MYTKLLAYGLDNIISWSSYVCNAIKELFIVSFIQVIYNDCNLNNMINLIPSKHLKLSTALAKKNRYFIREDEISQGNDIACTSKVNMEFVIGLRFK